MAQSFESWWASLRPITKFSLCLCLFLTITSSLGMIHPAYFILDWGRIWHHFEIWRLVTNLFFLGKFGLPFMFQLVFFVIYQSRLEEEAAPQGYLGQMGDHVWMMTIVALALFLIGGWGFGMQLLSFSFAMGIVWVWCKRHEEQELSFYGFSFKAAYFPWILTLIHMLMGANPLDDLVGIAAGHVYIFLKDILPDTHGLSLAETPQWVLRFLPRQRVQMAGVGGVERFAPADRGQPAAQPHRWPGGGRRLAE
eukprot:TRINITY_DN64959_c0_g1_i1.p2 TRINITY_DN64959_c0_g1~~TRINITY_DN64959_c0_g1_i1.p2  ORF type:complete len:292 (+),score=108.89 TRINITY_DN64959_c0_g1_i1:122-877(+)